MTAETCVSVLSPTAGKFCYVLDKNLTTFCPYSGNSSKAEFRSNDPTSLVEDNSRPPRTKAVACLHFTTVIQVHSERKQQVE